MMPTVSCFILFTSLVCDCVNLLFQQTFLCGAADQLLRHIAEHLRAFKNPLNPLLDLFASGTVRAPRFAVLAVIKHQRLDAVEALVAYMAEFEKEHA